MTNKDFIIKRDPSRAISFYAIEAGAHGRNVHVFATILWNDASAGEQDFRIAEYTRMIFPAAGIHQIAGESLRSILDENVAYMGDLTIEEAQRETELYFEGNEAKLLDFSKINAETPEGLYFSLDSDETKATVRDGTREYYKEVA